MVESLSVIENRRSMVLQPVQIAALNGYGFETRYLEFLDFS